MSRSTERAAEEARDRDGGFTLIEIVVALGIFTVVMTALLPQLIVGIKSTDTARLITQAKGIAQGQLERMRNLPYHVSSTAGDYLDVLDFYYRDAEPITKTVTCKVDGAYAVPQPDWTGYVTVTNRCDYEPATGPMYRYVSTPQAGFTVVVDTQFLSGATPPEVVTPPADYNNDNNQAASGDDTPASEQIGVTVTVLYSDRQTLRPVTTYSQIADQPTVTNRIKLSASATALEMGSITATDGAVSLSAGLLNLSGSLTYASTAGANLAAASAGLATGEQASGASSSVNAPPAYAGSTQLGNAGSLAAGCTLACWSDNRLDLAPVSSTSGLPQVGSQTSPMQALLTGSTNGGISFGNGAASGYRSGLSLSGPLVQLDPQATSAASGIAAGCRPGSTGTSSYVASSGYLTSAGGDSGTPSVEACAASRSSTISLFPTTFAPRGVVQVQLNEASADCTVTGSGHAASVAYHYDAVVKYHDGSGGADAYVTAGHITPGATTDPLAGVNLATANVGGGHVLGDYVASWSGLLDSSLTKTAANGVAAVQLPGVLTLTSQPVRTGTSQLLAADGTVAANNVDLTSTVSFSAGAVGCSAMDAR